jgi:tetratricopeptide (TPR) repeat protein
MAPCGQRTDAQPHRASGVAAAVVRAALAALAGLPLAAAPPAALAAPTVRDGNALAIAELLRSARLWQVLGHPDSERNVLRKLLAIDAREPRALLLLGELELRVGDGPEARRVLAALHASHPGSREDAELEALGRVYAQDKGGLADLRLALRGGNSARAQALARALFPGGRAPGDLANEFSGLLSSTPAGWDRLRAQLQERIAADPAPGDELTLYELLAQHADTRDQALRGFARLSHSHDLPPERVAEPWRQTLLAMGADDAGLAERQRFLERYPADSEVRGDLARVQAERIAAQQSDDDPGVQARLQAERALDAGAYDEAEALLRRSRDLRPDDGETVGTLGLLRLRQGRNAEALEQFDAAIVLEQAHGGARQRWRDLAASARYWSSLQRARALRDGGDLDGAARLVLSVRDTQPEQTEAYHLLAAIRLLQGQDAEAERLYRELLARDAGDARAWRGLLSVRLRAGRVDEALDEAQGLPLKANVAAADALDPGDLRDAIDRGAAAHPDTALRRLERAVRLLPRDPWLRYDLAQQYRRLQLPALARQVMDEGAALAPADDGMRYAAALVDAATDDDAAALAGIAAIPPERRTAGMQALAQRLRFEQALRRARTARAAGNGAEDLLWRQQALDEAGADPDRRLRVARADLSADDPEAARAVLGGLLGQFDTLSPEQRRDLLRVRIDAGDSAGALAQIDRLLAAAPAPGAEAGAVPAMPATAPPAPTAGRADLLLLRARAHAAQHDAAALRADAAALRGELAPGDIGRRIELVQILDADRPAARAAAAELLAQYPQDPDVLLEAARQAQRDHDYRRAVALLRQVRASPAPAARPGPLEGTVPLLALQPLDLDASGPAPSPGTGAGSQAQEEARRQLASIEARRQPHVDTAWMVFVRHADDGISTLRGNEIPLLGVWPQDYDGHWFAQVDAVRLDAGTLPASLAGAAQFGKVLALAPPSGLAAPVDESATGLSAAGGWRSDNRRWDLGIVGAGFKVPNIVGGWRENREWGDTDVSAELTRRVQTGSLLSYAGAADPVTGAVWGGVTDTALGVRASRDYANRWSASMSAELGLLTGRNVPSNVDLKWRGALGREWVHRPDFRLSAGAALSLWHYGTNESFYTFGQGGYYSPQRYVSIGVPIEIEGRHGLLSYDVRATPSRSWTYEQNTPYYPGSGSLQALAGDPIHVAGAGGGLAGSLRAVLEYRATAHWAVGGWLDIDRSAYYAPTRAMLYFRYWFTPQQGPVDYPPYPVVPISLY